MSKHSSESNDAQITKVEGKPLRAAGVSSRVRKASVRAALFKKPALIRIGRFTLLERIGAGAMGEVYAAYDDQLDRKVALKLVRSGLQGSTRADARLLREAQTLARVAHPNVVQVYEAGTYEGGVFIAMELIHGKPLSAWLETTSAMPRRQRRREVLRQLMAAGRGLEAAHQAGLAHRDFKPDNVLVGDDGRVRVVDFGLARALTQGSATAAGDAERAGATGRDAPPKAALRLTATGTVMGTPRYMAPEQLRGHTADHRSDQFSFCVALFHALYDQWPFQGEGLVGLMRTVTEGELTLPKRTSDVPAPIRKALLRGLSREPADRFPDMGALLRALEIGPQRRRRGLLALAATALATTGALASAAMDARPDPCARVTSEVDALWSPARKHALRAAFGNSGLAYAETAWRNTEALLDEYVATWRHQAKTTCETAPVRQVQWAERLDRRTLCLARGKQHLGALLASFASNAAGAVEHAVEAASSLPDLAVCSDADALLRDVAPPDRPALAQAVTAVRKHLAEARTHALFGRYDEALRIAEEQRSAVEDLPYAPVHAEVLHQLGRALAGRGNGDDMERVEHLYFAALDIAEGARHDRLTVDIWHDLVLLAEKSHSDMVRGHDWARLERAAVRRMSDRPHDLAQASHALGLLYYREANYAEAAEQYRQAIDILEDQQDRAGKPPEGQQRRATKRAAYYHDLANAEKELGHHGRARELFERALRMSIELLGAEHPRAARLQRDFSMMLIESEDFDRARSLLESALSTW